MPAFLFTHFSYRDEGRGDLEKIQFAVSHDGWAWEPLHGGRAILENPGNTGGLRDPFPYRCADGSHVILATDLNTSGPGFTWADASDRGSQDIIVFRSGNLVDWSAPEAARMPLPDATSAWAPKVVEDDDGVPVVLWSARRGGKTKVYGARTRDFRAYEPPFVFAEGGMDRIDALVHRHEGIWYRFVKDEARKAVLMERAPALRGPWREVSGYTLESLRNVEGPAAIVWPDGRALLLLDHYARGPESRYRAFYTDDLASGRFLPADDRFRETGRMKHGGIIPITGEECARLKERFD